MLVWISPEITKFPVRSGSIDGCYEGEENGLGGLGMQFEFATSGGLLEPELTRPWGIFLAGFQM